MVYYVNNKPQLNGDHEVHKETCIYLPVDRTFLGHCNNCKEAVSKARHMFPSANGCYHCARECHTS